MDTQHQTILEYAELLHELASDPRPIDPRIVQAIAMELFTAMFESEGVAA
jgi:hypothetical protein